MGARSSKSIINAADLSSHLYLHKFQRANDATSLLDAAHRVDSLEAVCNFKVRVWFMVHGCTDFHRCQIFVGVRQLNGLGRATDGRMLSGCPSEILLEVGAERQILFEAPIFFVAFVFLVLVLVLNDALLHRHSRLLDPFGEPRYARCSFQFFHRERFTRPLFTAVAIVPRSPFVQLFARQTPTDACTSSCSTFDTALNVRTIFFF